MPVLHDIIEHGAKPRWDVLGFIALFAVITVASGWTLLRTPPGRR